MLTQCDINNKPPLSIAFKKQSKYGSFNIHIFIDIFEYQIMKLFSLQLTKLCERLPLYCWEWKMENKNERKSTHTAIHRAGCGGNYIVLPRACLVWTRVPPCIWSITQKSKNECIGRTTRYFITCTKFNNGRNPSCSSRQKTPQNSGLITANELLCESALTCPVLSWAARLESAGSARP